MADLTLLAPVLVAFGIVTVVEGCLLAFSRAKEAHAVQRIPADTRDA